MRKFAWRCKSCIRHKSCSAHLTHLTGLLDYDDRWKFSLKLQVLHFSCDGIEWARRKCYPGRLCAAHYKWGTPIPVNNLPVQHMPHVSLHIRPLLSPVYLLQSLVRCPSKTTNISFQEDPSDRCLWGFANNTSTGETVEIILECIVHKTNIQLLQLQFLSENKQGNQGQAYTALVFSWCMTAICH